MLPCHGVWHQSTAAFVSTLVQSLGMILQRSYSESKRPYSSLKGPRELNKQKPNLSAVKGCPFGASSCLKLELVLRLVNDTVWNTAQEKYRPEVGGQQSVSLTASYFVHT